MKTKEEEQLNMPCIVQSEQKSTIHDITEVQQAWETLSEQLYFTLNEYRFGRIDFLELLKRWEEILNISPSIKV